MTDPIMVAKLAKLQVAAENGNPLIKLLVSPEQFKAWLLSKHPEEVVGNSLDCYENPVANYLESLGFQSAIVDEGYVGVDIDDDYGWELCIENDSPKFPKWLNQFENHLVHIECNREITASYALLVLDVIEMQDKLKRAE